MSENKSQPIEIGWAAVAWTQFLVSITVIDKADMNRVWEFFATFANTPHALNLDSRPFGSLALVLNVVSLALFTFPLIGWHTWEQDSTYLERYRLHARKLAIAAFLFWLFSFLALLCYFNPIFAVVAVLGFMLGGIGLLPLVRRKK